MRKAAIGTEEAVSSVAEFLKGHRTARPVADAMARDIIELIQHVLSGRPDGSDDETKVAIAAFRNLAATFDAAEAAMRQIIDDEMLRLRVMARQKNRPLPDIGPALRLWRDAAVYVADKMTAPAHAPSSQMKFVYAELIMRWERRTGRRPGRKEATPLYLAIRHALKILDAKPRGYSFDSYEAAHAWIDEMHAEPDVGLLDPPHDDAT